MPEDYIRKQTIAGGERFITPELKEHEEKVLRADELILAHRDPAVRGAARRAWPQAARRIQQTSRATAALDVLASLAEAATRFDYVKPRLTRGDELSFVEGRHPIMERVLDEPFVANDLDHGRRRPAAAHPHRPQHGRQVHLPAPDRPSSALMAQMGSFVPAREAKLGPRRPHLHPGGSERPDPARAVHLHGGDAGDRPHPAPRHRQRSLVLLDEIGRGTATFDGLSIAWAVAEHIARVAGGPKTIFATHYHELIDLAADIPGVGNLHVSAREWQDTIVFLRKIEAGRLGPLLRHPGGAPRRPARLGRGAGPGDPAQPGEHRVRPRGPAPPGPLRRATPRAGARQLALFAGQDEAVLDELRRADPDSLTPLQALALLAELRSGLAP